MKAPKIWDIKRKIMHEPEEICRLSFDKCELYAVLFWDDRILFKKDMEVLRPTECKDKYGKEMFEGHIITDGVTTDSIEYNDKMGVFFWSGGEDWGEIDSAYVWIVGDKYRGIYEK